MHASLVELNPNPVFRVDANGQVLYANPAAQTLLNSSPAIDWPAIFRERTSNANASLPAESSPAIPARIFVETSDCIYEFSLIPDPMTTDRLAFGEDVTALRRLEAERLLSE